MEIVLKPEDIKEMHSFPWFHAIPLGKDQEGNPVITPGICKYFLFNRTNGRFGLPPTFEGLKVADIGGWDGYFAFEAERRGAIKVVVYEVDQSEGGNWGEEKGFHFAKRILKSRVQLVRKSVYCLNPQEELFDVVFFFGVLYHLKAPYIALEKLFSIIKEGGYALIETAIAPGDAEEEPHLLFLPGRDQDTTNYFYPNLQGLYAMLYHVGFKKIELVHQNQKRCTIKAHKSNQMGASSPTA